MSTDQESVWSSSFGEDYNRRNTYNLQELDKFYTNRYTVSRSEMNAEFLGALDKDVKILEVGCNIGNQLNALQKMGFKNLYGIELQWDAVSGAKKHTNKINIIQGSAFDIPFKDGYFDLVYTAGVLIHISPNDIGKIMSEMYRVSKKFIWGFEYYNPEYIEINYRGNSNLLWKGDFAKIFIEKFPELQLNKEKIYPYTDENVEDKMYLLSK